VGQCEGGDVIGMKACRINQAGNSHLLTVGRDEVLGACVLDADDPVIEREFDPTGFCVVFQ